MGRFFGIVICTVVLLKGFGDLVTYFQNPEFVKISLQEIDNNGVADLKFVEISGGLTNGDHIVKGSGMGIIYPLINMDKMEALSVSKKYRAKVIVTDVLADSISYGMKTIKGRIMPGQLNDSNEAILKEFCVPDSDYITVANGWSKPNLWLSLLLIIVPGFLLWRMLTSYSSKSKSEELSS